MSLNLTSTRNSGFLKYWTFSNIPLFFLAAPMLCIMAQSALWGLSRDGPKRLFEGQARRDAGRTARFKTSFTDSTWTWSILCRYSIPQIVLVTLALTNYHVQIITRLSSGYPVWYWWLASMISEKPTAQLSGKKWNLAGITVRWMVIYGLVQGGLFASFLPPA